MLSLPDPLIPSTYKSGLQQVRGQALSSGQAGGRNPNFWIIRLNRMMTPCRLITKITLTLTLSH